MIYAVDAPGGSASRGARAAAALRRWLTVILVTGVLGVAAGFLWAALAPRPYLVMTGRGAAAVVNAETGAFIGGDGWYCVICLAGGILSGLAGYLVAVRGSRPAGMAVVLLSALGAGLLTLWIGEQSGLATYHHLLATLPAGAHLRASLSLGTRSGIAFWPLGAGIMAGALELSVALRERRQGSGGGPALAVR
jgi:hypothetical protein